VRLSSCATSRVTSVLSAIGCSSAQHVFFSCDGVSINEGRLWEYHWYACRPCRPEPVHVHCLARPVQPASKQLVSAGHVIPRVQPAAGGSPMSRVHAAPSRLPASPHTSVRCAKYISWTCWLWKTWRKTRLAKSWCHRSVLPTSLMSLALRPSCPREWMTRVTLC
jgi:hypothetical protein